MSSFVKDIRLIASSNEDGKTCFKLRLINHLRNEMIRVSCYYLTSGTAHVRVISPSPTVDEVQQWLNEEFEGVCFNVSIDRGCISIEFDFKHYLPKIRWDR